MLFHLLQATGSYRVRTSITLPFKAFAAIFALQVGFPGIGTGLAEAATSALLSAATEEKAKLPPLPRAERLQQQHNNNNNNNNVLVITA